MSGANRNMHPRMKKSVLLTLLTLALCLSAAAQSTVEVFDRYVESARRSWDVPGMSVVVVQDGKVVFAKGYGVRELGKNEPVDTSTLFGAMSTTKAMTDRKSTRLNSSHGYISYAVFCLKKK